MLYSQFLYEVPTRGQIDTYPARLAGWELYRQFTTVVALTQVCNAFQPCVTRFNHPTAHNLNNGNSKTHKVYKIHSI